MKKAIILAVLLTASVPFNSSLSQEVDSLMLSTSYIYQGDTASLVLSLVNQTIRVGGFSTRIFLADSTKARFIDVERGESISDFSIFMSPFSDGSLRITGMAITFPMVDTISPLPLGYHELAVIRIALDDTVAEGSHLPVAFDCSNEYGNAIVDSAGYIIIIPVVVDGEIVINRTADIYNDNQIPYNLSLGNNYPNPFNAGTSFEFVINEHGYVKFEIYDILGKKVACLFDSYTSAGTYTLRWNGFSDSGQPAASGVYLYMLSLDGKDAVKKMTLLK
ncbi:MAG: T9SS type A sorting domain-containing protein [candidate division Zixibacteria bacterium]|nr:T9SS type A sorting domain-containing protein [candidate division Zixibacteria bacterium]